MSKLPVTAVVGILIVAAVAVAIGGVDAGVGPDADPLARGSGPGSGGEDGSGAEPTGAATNERGAGTGADPNATGGDGVDPPTGGTSDAASGGVATAAPDAVVDGGAGVPEVAVSAADDATVDTVGWEAGYWYDDPIDVDQSDGLSEAELDALLARSMARVEAIRGLEFVEEVDVEVITPDEHARRFDVDATNASVEYDRWNDQVWEALFVVGEDRAVADEFDRLRGANVPGYYDPRTGQVVLVSNAPRPVVDPGTLVHELVHALQDQQFGLGTVPDTQDAQLARNGLIEGEAEYVTALHDERCGVEWDCLPTPRGGGGGGPAPEPALLWTVFQPYSDGPAYVDDLVRTGGWTAVDAAHGALPRTTERVIHAGANDSPATATAIEGVDVRDRHPPAPTGGWERFAVPGDGSDTLGEASIFVLFWNQAETYRTPVVDADDFWTPDSASAYDVYDYTSDPSVGWAGDAVVPYQRDGGTGTATETGYVWVTAWDTERDAVEFRHAYLTVLLGWGADYVGDETYVIERGPFADAFRVTVDDTTVTVVNGPTVESLDELAPTPVDADASDPDSDPA